MLSRGGFELYEGWVLQEQYRLLQENLNKMHQTWQESGSREHRDAWHKAMSDAGLGEHSAKIIMKPHVDRFRQARKDFMGLARKGRRNVMDRPSRTPAETDAIVRAREHYEASRDAMQRTATEIGHHNRHGEFIHPEEGQHPLDHVDELGHAYGSRIDPRQIGTHEGARQREGLYYHDSETHTQLPDKKAVAGFHSAVEKHHGSRMERKEHAPIEASSQRQTLARLAGKDPIPPRYLTTHTLRDKKWTLDKLKKGDRDFDPSDDEGDEWKTRG